jgi:hypothetical protein
MLLSARILNNVANVNVFSYDDTARFSEGDAPDIYFQLTDASLDRSADGFSPGGRRYMPTAGATLQVTLGFIDDTKKVVRAAVQPFPLDPSIWKLTLLTTDKVRGSADLQLKLTEGSKVTFGVLRQAISVDTQSLGF